jgi:DNA-binding CsgD family transcriptional regulator
VTFGPLIANELLDDEANRSVAVRLERAARSRGALLVLQHALLNTAAVDTRAGRFEQAKERYAEVLDVTALVGQWVDFYALLDVELLAWRGDPATLGKARDLEEQGRAAGSHATVYMALHARSVFELGRGHYQEALDAARPVVAEDAFGYSCRALPNLVEAAARCGDAAAGEAALAKLADRAGPGSPPSARGLHERSAALLADDDVAESHHCAAIDLLGSTQLRTDLARAHLLYGEWLRRVNRRLDAREQLRTSYEQFAGMGAEAFAERARVELAATGEHARRRTSATTNDLTPQEAQIARLAAERMTSREIGAQLFISAKTVEYHLGKVFRKLSVSTRRDLPDALARVGLERALS